jgi:hypothetical protein
MLENAKVKSFSTEFFMSYTNVIDLYAKVRSTLVGR